MVHKENRDAARGPILARSDLEEELHRLRESKMLLVLMAENAGLDVPRSCCPHQGERACVSCCSDWLVAYVRMANEALN